MKKISFLINQAANGSYVAHALEWAAYTQADNRSNLEKNIIEIVNTNFDKDEYPGGIILIDHNGNSTPLCA